MDILYTKCTILLDKGGKKVYNNVHGIHYSVRFDNRYNIEAAEWLV